MIQLYVVRSLSIEVVDLQRANECIQAYGSDVQLSFVSAEAAEALHLCQIALDLAHEFSGLLVVEGQRQRNVGLHASEELDRARVLVVVDEDPLLAIASKMNESAALEMHHPNRHSDLVVRA